MTMRVLRSTKNGRAIRCGVALAAILLSQSHQASAAEALAAVATNFAEVMEALAPEFAALSGHTALLETSPQGVAGSRFTYAIGRLTLWSADAARITGDGAAILRAGGFRHLAMANPKLAPYGLAAQQTLTALGVWDSLRGRIVLGENVGQAFSLVATGNAELGLVALSAVVSARNTRPGSRWDVPVDLYQPIRQDAVLLAHGADNPAARAFLGFLRSAKAQKAIAAFGYGAD
jgi:molybdate transport system substrate-binding protein